MHTYNNNRSNKLNFDRSLGFLQASNPVRKMCSKVANSIYFSRAILFVVILNGVIVALDTPDRGVEMYGTKPHIPKDVTFWLGNAFLILFGLEAIVKIVAHLDSYSTDQTRTCGRIGTCLICSSSSPVSWTSF